VLPANALRLSALVAAATASGYFWRGAVELRKHARSLPLAAPAIAFELPKATLRPLAHLHVRVPRAPSRASKRRVVIRATPRRSTHTSRSGASQLIASVQATPTSSAPKHQSRVRPVRPATPRTKPPAKSPQPKPAPPPVSPPAPTPPPPVGVAPAPDEKKQKREKGDKKEKKQKQAKCEHKEKQQKNDEKQEKKDKADNGQGKGKKEKK
jgi:hypothetical protein